MATERTLSIIKPDATRRNLTGKINAKFEEAGLRIVAQRRIRMTEAQAGEFYGVHRERPFFGGLVAFMTSGPVVVQVLEGENAVAENRRIMGATNPKNADAGTIRAEFAEDIEANSVHGSDSAENAATEIAFFFSDDQIVGCLRRKEARPGLCPGPAGAGGPRPRYLGMGSGGGRLAR
jgi:nucleoside-diphosphate kinase